jgi:hypothetical protein
VVRTAILYPCKSLSHKGVPAIPTHSTLFGGEGPRCRAASYSVWRVGCGTKSLRSQWRQIRRTALCVLGVSVAKQPVSPGKPRIFFRMFAFYFGLRYNGQIRETAG